MQKWEYMSVDFGVHMSAIIRISRWEMEVGTKLLKGEAEVMAELNRLGAEGWELVSFSTGTDHNGNITKALGFFKRPVA